MALDNNLYEAFDDEDDFFHDDFNDADEYMKDFDDEEEDDKPLKIQSKPAIKQPKKINKIEQTVEPVATEEPAKAQTGTEETSKSEETKKETTGINVMLSRVPMEWRKFNKDGQVISYKPLEFSRLDNKKGTLHFNMRQGDRTEGKNPELFNRFDKALIECIKAMTPKIDKLIVKAVTYMYSPDTSKIWMYPTDQTVIFVLDGKTQKLKKQVKV